MSDFSGWGSLALLLSFLTVARNIESSDTAKVSDVTEYVDQMQLLRETMYWFEK